MSAGLPRSAAASHAAKPPKSASSRVGAESSFTLPNAVAFLSLRNDHKSDWFSVG